MTSQITFIGAGNMARSLISGLLASGHPAAALRAADPQEAQRTLTAELGLVVGDDNEAAVRGADVVVLAVKPQVLGKVLEELEGLTAKQLIVSIAAGVSLESLERWCPPRQPIVRCMPNTPALLGAGITALYANKQVNEAQRHSAAGLLDAVGKTLWVSEEQQLDAVTAVSGSGPAYFFYLMEAMIDAGVALGLDRADAEQLTLETAYGAARMARETGTAPAELRRNVTSPGGTTQRALETLEAGGVRQAINDALAGAATRSRELAKEFGQS